MNTLTANETPQDKAAGDITFTHGEHTIYDPYVSPCNTYRADPVRDYGFEEICTGGNNAALYKKLPNNQHILLTDLDGASTPTGPTDCLMGLYDDDGAGEGLGCTQLDYQSDLTHADLPPIPLTPERIAPEFLKVLKEWLTPEQYREMIELNAAETDSGICHSGDYCDSNMAMDAAIRNLGHAEMLDADDWAAKQENADLWNAAWDLAKVQMQQRAKVAA